MQTWRIDSDSTLCDCGREMELIHWPSVMDPGHEWEMIGYCSQCDRYYCFGLRTRHFEDGQ